MGIRLRYLSLQALKMRIIALGSLLALSNGKDIDVTKRPGKLMGKWAEIIAAAPLGDPAKQRFIAKMEQSRSKIFDAYFKFRDTYECDFPDTWVEEEEDDPDRYDRDDPCKAVGQIAKGMEKWSAIFNRNCFKSEREFKFHDRMTQRLKNIRNNVRRLMECNWNGSD